MPVFKKVNKEFFKKWSPDMAYVLGFFAADGNLSVNKRGGCYIAFHSKDRQIIKDVRTTLCSDNKISKRTNPNKGSYYRLQIGSKDIVNELLCLGFSTSKIKHLPFIKIPETFFSHFVRGYFDGDGNIWQGEVHKERKTSLKVLQLSFTSGAYDFLSNLKEYLHCLLNTDGSHVVFKNGAYSRLQYSTKDALKIKDFMYNDTTLYLRRKKDHFERNVRNLRL